MIIFANLNTFDQQSSYLTNARILRESLLYLRPSPQMSDVKAWVLDISDGVWKLFQYLSKPIIAKAEWSIDVLPQYNKNLLNTYTSPVVLFY